jgi:cell division protein FtsI/penicillin-binding protein 2
MKKKVVIISVIAVAVIALITVAILVLNKEKQNPEEILKTYFAYIEKQNYEEMYNMVHSNTDKEEFLKRNKNIYEGIHAKKIKIEITSIQNEKKKVIITYLTKMNTSAGDVEFENTAKLSKDDSKKYKIEWSSNLIFPELNNDYKVRVSNTEGKRGSILDRNGNILAETKTNREYPYKDITAHITGYVQGITAEELESKAEKGYNPHSIIGKTGLEQVYEERLKGKDGLKIYIEDNNGNIVKTIAETKGNDGEDIKLTIDINLQTKLYEKIKNDKGFFVVMNPQTGEILALVSTPSYDPNKFVTGMTNNEWNSISTNEAKPLFTRFISTWCPGSTFKPITGAIGLTTGNLSEDDEFNYSGLAWQKDSSWGDHKITTLTAYSGKKNLKNALIHSDNIYFAQAALKIGEKTFTEGLDKIKFNEDIDFELDTNKSTYSNSERIEREATLADSGYGQGQLLVNPIHMASIYSAFVNEGNMVKPYIEYKENREKEYLVKNAFSKEAANIIREDLIQVVESPTGTAHDLKVNGVKLAGKTGTAELKASKEEKGKTLGWFNCFTVDEELDKSMLIVSMVEDGGSNGGSRYLKKIIRTLFE